MTDAALGTGGVTQQFVVTLWTMLKAVAQVGGVHAYPGRAATVVTAAREIRTVFFVFVARTVVDIVTQYKDGQAVAAAGTQEVCVWTRYTSSCKILFTPLLSLVPDIGHSKRHNTRMC